MGSEHSVPLSADSTPDHMRQVEMMMKVDDTKFAPDSNLYLTQLISQYKEHLAIQ